MAYNLPLREGGQTTDNEATMREEVKGQRVTSYQKMKSIRGSYRKGIEGYTQDRRNM